jgi:flagellar biosynthesis protein FliP
MKLSNNTGAFISRCASLLQIVAFGTLALSPLSAIAAGGASVLPSALPRADAATTQAVRTAVILTVLALGPTLMVSMTAFIRISIVLAMVRHAFGMPETPPNAVLVSLALILTFFVMGPTAEKINDQALQPFISGELGIEAAAQKSSAPLRDFMLRQTKEPDLRMMYELSHKALPAAREDVSLVQLTPAFILNELRVSFQIGFVVLLPFLLIDLIVSSILLGLGMMMVPPSTISLPLKVLMFVLIDGWGLVVHGTLGSFR